jgi:hypothetical protein
MNDPIREKQAEIIEWLKICIQYNLKEPKRLKGLNKLESELSALIEAEKDNKKYYKCSVCKGDKIYYDEEEGMTCSCGRCKGTGIVNYHYPHAIEVKSSNTSEAEKEEKKSPLEKNGYSFETGI